MQEIPACRILYILFNIGSIKVWCNNPRIILCCTFFTDISSGFTIKSFQQHVKILFVYASTKTSGCPQRLDSFSSLVVFFIYLNAYDLSKHLICTGDMQRVGSRLFFLLLATRQKTLVKERMWSYCSFQPKNIPLRTMVGIFWNLVASFCSYVTRRLLKFIFHAHAPLISSFTCTLFESVVIQCPKKIYDSHFNTKIQGI